MKKKFSVSIVETLSTFLEIEADSKEEAEDIAEEKWKNSEVILDYNDFKNVEFTAIEDE